MTGKKKCNEESLEELVYEPNIDDIQGMDEKFEGDPDYLGCIVSPQAKLPENSLDTPKVSEVYVSTT